MTATQDERRLLVEDRLQAARGELPEIAPAIDYYGALIGALLGEEARIEAPELGADGVRRKFEAGEPLLHGESLGLDEPAIRALLVRLCHMTEQFGKVPDDLNPRRLSWWQSYRRDGDAAFARGVEAAKIRRALEEGELDFGALMDAMLGGGDEQLVTLASHDSLDSDLMTILSRFAMRPTMRTFARAMEPSVREFEEDWQHAFCPICGSPPAFTEIGMQSESGNMRCATCGTSWRHSLVRCPFCGENQLRSVALPTAQDDARYLVYGCGACKRYIKAVLTESPIADDLLPLEDLLTLPLDAAAQTEGYLK